MDQKFSAGSLLRNTGSRRDLLNKGNVVAQDAMTFSIYIPLLGFTLLAQ